MSKTIPSGILLRGEAQTSERLALAAIDPGDIVEVGGVIAGTTLNGVQRQATAAAACQMNVALRYTATGGTKSDAYKAKESVLYGAMVSGNIVQLRLAAGAAAIVVGDKLESAGAGTVRKLNAGVFLATALQGVDNSSAATKAFIKAEVA